MKILNLKDDPVHLEQLAEWHHREWAYLNPGQSLADRIEEMSAHLHAEIIPGTFIAKEGHELVGSAALLESDMDIHKDLSPWLASVFVSPNHRGKGVGASLVKHLMAVAKESGIGELYLFTPSKESFYKRLGWNTLVKEDYRGASVTIMSVKLNG